MNWLKNQNLKIKLTIYFLTLSIIPLIITVFVLFNISKNNIETEAKNKLIAVTQNKEDQIKSYFSNIIIQTENTGLSQNTKDAFYNLREYHNKMNTQPDESYNVCPQKVLDKFNNILIDDFIHSVILKIVN